jgi:mevalonate kinase
VFRIIASDIQTEIETSEGMPLYALAVSDPLARIAHLTFERLSASPPCATMTISSDIPIGANLGSGAAVSVAIVRALAACFGRVFPPEEVSALAYEVEKLHHGTPSGIDNTVVAYEQPVWFVRGQPPSLLSLSKDQGGVRGEADLPLVIADTGFSTPTRIPVGDVRAAWERDRECYEGLFDAIASLVALAREALLHGDLIQLGEVMNANHILLQRLDVSCQALDDLCDAARAAGALGAKMSGGGRGGNMIALAKDAGHAEELRHALLAAGATRVIV